MGSLRILDISFAAVVVLATGVFVPVSGVRAQDASAALLFSKPTPHSTVRVITADRDPTGGLSAGVQITLKPGWKTYWRTPGDSGMPPSFDWSRSENLAAVEVDWPAPTRFSEHGETIYGYRDEVIFPVKLTPKDPDEPVKLALSLFYAVCKEICVPVQAEIAAKVDPSGSDLRAKQAISRFAARVPKEDVDGLALRSASLERSKGASSSLVVEVIADDTATPIDIIVETEKSGISFGAPEKVDGPGPAHKFKLAVEGKQALTRLQGANVGLTIVQGDKALARSVVLD